MRGGTSPGVNFLFGYTQVHPVCFRIVIKVLSESNIQTPLPGAMPDVDPTLDFMERGDLPNSFLLLAFVTLESLKILILKRGVFPLGTQ